VLETLGIRGTAADRVLTPLEIAAEIDRGKALEGRERPRDGRPWLRDDGIDARDGEAAQEE
jgi:hypothetical protein